MVRLLRSRLRRGTGLPDGAFTALYDLAVDLAVGKADARKKAQAHSRWLRRVRRDHEFVLPARAQTHEAIARDAALAIFPLGHHVRSALDLVRMTNPALFIVEGTRNLTAPHLTRPARHDERGSNWL